MPKLTFLGAAGTVTGSKYLVEAAGKRLLVDCGIFQGTPELSDRNYKPLPTDPKTIDYVVLTHAHLDHTGLLPRLVRDGYRGTIFANPATIELTTLLLKDSAHLQEEDSQHAQANGYTNQANPQPLYTAQDVDPALRAMKPMARSATDLYLKHTEDHDLDYTREDSGGKGDPLGVHQFHLTRTTEESKQINNVKTPCIIVSASGMVTGGRVMHHLAQRLPDSRNAVILAGFQAQGTRGRALQEGAKTIRLFNQDVPVNAEIVELGQFSAHAGKSELLRWLTALPAPPKQTYLTHGEPAAAHSLQSAIREKFKWNVSVARYLDTVALS